MSFGTARLAFVMTRRIHVRDDDTMAVRGLAPTDGAWMAKLMARRRAEYEAYSPVFWRRAVGVDELHTAFLIRVVEQSQNIALRTDDGFITAVPRAGQYYADDFAVDDDGTWAVDGRTLVRAAWTEAKQRGATALRVVTAARDAPKRTMLADTGMSVAERWWVKALNADPAGTIYEGSIAGDGFTAVLSAAPPVYNPGGPVVIITAFDDVDALGAAEHQAINVGVVLGILPIVADSWSHEGIARDAGYEVASEFFLGQPL
jgi:hypothetical protein